MKCWLSWLSVVGAVALTTSACEIEPSDATDAATPEPDAAVVEPEMDAAVVPPASDAGGEPPEEDAAVAPPATSCGDLVLEPVACEGEPSDLSDNITSDTTLEAGCYRVTRNIRVTATLTIEPGTTLRFAQGTALEVRGDGALNARGTEEAPIAFLGVQETRGFWQGIEFQGTNTLSNVLEYVLVAHAGSGSFAYTSTTPANIVLSSPSATTPSVAITHTVSRDSAGYGLYVGARAAARDFSNNVFTGNELGAAYVHATTMRNLDATSCYTGNESDVVTVQNQTVTSDSIWPAIDARYQMRGNTTLQAHVTIEPGAVLSFASDASLSIRDSGGDSGALTAEGTDEANIVFTGEQKTRGYWRGIEIQGVNRTENSFDHVVIEYAGGGSTFAYTGSTAANVVLSSPSNSTASLALKNTTIRESAGYGLYLPARAALRDFEGNTLTENALGAAFVHATTIRNLDDTSTYAGNDEDRVVVTNQAVSTAGTWPAIDVPYEMRGATNVEAHVTIQPGATLAFAMGAALSVRADGALTAVGTDEAPIRFTGAQETPGFWRGIEFQASDSVENVFDHVVVEYGGGGSTFAYTGSTSANVVLTTPSSSTSRLTLTNTTIRHSEGYGMFVSSGAVMSPGDWSTGAGNVFTDNASGAHTD